MGRVQIPFKGISTTSIYEDGECYSLVNLRPKNGALHPVAPRKILQELSQRYDIVFVHQNNNYKNWIGVINADNKSSVFWDIINEPKLINTNIDGTIHSIEQIGNTLSLVSSKNIYYLLFQNDNYRFLGELPDLPAISLATSSNSELLKIKKEYKDEYSGASINKDNWEEYTKGLVNKAIDEQTEYYMYDAFFVRYAIRLYDGSLVKHSAPILAMYDLTAPFMKNVYYKIDGDNFVIDGSYINVCGFKLKIAYDLRQLSGWEDIIQSVDIFISAPLGLTSMETNKYPFTFRDTQGQYVTSPLVGSDKAMLKSISEESKFHFVKQLNIGDFVDKRNPIIFPSSENKDEYKGTEVLLQQERMSDDNFSHHRYGSETSYSYNGRLHLGNVNTSFFNGFKPTFFDWDGERYNGSPGSFDNKYKELIIETELNTGYKIEKTYSSHIYSSPRPLFWSAFISYPDTRAKKMTVYGIDENNQCYILNTFNLKPHSFLNLAYHLNDDNGIYIRPVRSDNEVDRSEYPDINKQIEISEPNKIKVSELNNPLNFPSINTYQVGNGIIMAMATNAMNVSDRNKGQFPLYIFTSQGIWSLNVGQGEVVYSTLSDPTYTEPPTTSIIGETPLGVVFTTQQGLRIINGQSVNLLSSQIEEQPIAINIELPEAQCKDVVHLFNDKSFKDYILHIDSITYNPHESELIICDKESAFSYVLNLSDQSFHQSTEQVDIVVGNVFPKLLVIGDNKLKDYASSNNPETHVCLVSRPLLFGTSDIKNLERVIFRGLLVNIKNLEEKKSLIMVHHSNDGVNFPALRGLTTNPCNRRDYDMGLFASSKFSQFMFIFAGVVDETSRINLLDVTIRQEYNNTKMR